MENAKITYISDLDLAKDNYKLKVRVIRLWKLTVWKKPEQVYGIEMVLMDEQGNKIQAYVTKNNMPRFERILRESECYYVYKPSIGSNMSAVKIVDNQQKLGFYSTTMVTRCREFNGPFYGFNFADFDSVLGKQIPENAIIDVIGEVVQNFGQECVPTKNGEESDRTNLGVQDKEGRKINVTLWGEFSKQLQDYLSSNPVGVRLIIILQFGRLKFWNGRPYVSTCYGGTRLLINSDVAEITSFRDRLIGSSTPSNSSNSLSMRSLVDGSGNSEFLYETFTPIAEICEIFEEKTVVIVGTIKHIAADKGWYYPGCKRCTKKVTTTMVIIDNPDSPGQVMEEELMICTTPRCKNTVISSIPRYRIEIRVQDATGVVSLTLFDRDASQLLKQTAAEMLANFDEDSCSGAYPDGLKILLERKFAFKFEITRFNLDKNYQVYGVMKLSEDTTLLSSLENKLTFNEQLSGSDTVDVMLTEPLNSDVIGFKDTVSSTDENVTPILATNKCNLASGIVDASGSRAEGGSSGLKRALIDVYDVDDAADCSSTRPSKRTNMEGYKFDKTKLLVPKIEK